MSIVCCACRLSHITCGCAQLPLFCSHFAHYLSSSPAQDYRSTAFLLLLLLWMTMVMTIHLFEEGGHQLTKRRVVEPPNRIR
jgi:hypothetical protein